ncbi:hypothetical protein BJX62DRAFT_247515 [Aspergillus germanicus]
MAINTKYGLLTASFATSTPRLRVSPLQAPEGMECISNIASKTGKGGRQVLLSPNKWPEWFQHSGHASFYSWSYIHKLANIYSHLIPAVFFLLGGWQIQQYLASRYSGVTTADFMTFSIFMLTAATCLLLSATYHTLMNHSQHVERLCLQLDILGVVIFILGDLILGIYIIFWCEPLPRHIHWSMIMRKAFPYILVKAGCLLSELLFYAFDLWGSHSIFHILVVCAAVVQLIGYLDAFDYCEPHYIIAAGIG